MTFSFLESHKFLTPVPLRPTLEHALTALNTKTKTKTKSKQKHVTSVEQLKCDFQTGMTSRVER